MGVRDSRGIPAAGRRPCRAGPSEPRIAALIERVERLVAEFGELRAPPGPATHGIVLVDGPDDVDLLAVVHLIPERLQHFSYGRSFGIAAVHQPGDVLEADVAGQQLFVIQDADAAVTLDPMTLEREVDFLNAVPLGAGTEVRLRARSAAAEQDAVGWIHRGNMLTRCPSIEIDETHLMLRTMVRLRAGDN